MDATFWDQLKVALGLDEPGAVQFAARFIQILVVAFITVLVSHWIRRRIERLARSNTSYADAGVLASRGVALLIYILGFTAVLAIAGANWTVLATVLGAAAFGLSLAFQDVAKNFVDGTYLLIERPFRHGDRIRVGDVQGRVERFGVRHTTVRTDSGSRIAVPNTIVFTSSVENATLGVRDYQELMISGVNSDMSQTEVASLASLARRSGTSQREVAWRITAIGPEGMDIALGIDTAAGGEEVNRLMRELHGLFPDATIRINEVKSDQ